MIVGIVGEHEEPFSAIIDADTYFMYSGKTNKKAMSVGDAIRVYYNKKAPSLMIYPPIYNADVVALNLDEMQVITIARFDATFASLANNLKIAPDAEMEIVYAYDGSPFEGEMEELIGRKLAVLYSMTTMSMPPIAIPEKIVILVEKAAHPIYMLTDEEKAALAAAFANAEIVINGEVLDAPKAFLDENGTLMVPVRAISEALGFEVAWLGDTQTVSIGGRLTFNIGVDGYSFAKMAPTPLGISAPVLVNDRTFVAINLFEFIGDVGLANVDYYFESGKLIITVSE
jgi:hypothetical protein